MIQFINNRVKLDLTNSGVSFIKENHWFKDTLFQEYSLPVTVYLDEDRKKMFGLIGEYNSLDDDTIFQGWLYRDGVMEQASLEIIGITGDMMKLNIRLTGNKLNNWEKKLASLGLESFELQGEDIYQHAATTITKVYPDVNYNFPSVWTDRFDKSSATFAEFKGMLNAWDSDNNDWYRNEIDSTNNIIYNRNILQPFPYLLHILTVGFSEAGYQLDGDILTDEEVTKALVVAAVDYFSTSDQQEMKIEKGYQEYDTFYYRQCNRNNNIQVLMAEYSALQDITHVGRYRIIGEIGIVGSDCAPEKIEIKYGDDVLFIYERNEQEWPNNVSVHIDVTFEVSSIDINAGKKVSLFVLDRLNSSTDKKIQLNINPIRYHNESGDAADVVYLPNEINLKRTVPDMTFGDLVKAVMNWKNLDFQIVDDKIVMNYLSTSIDRNTAIDLTDYNSYRPEITLNKTTSFELKFTDSDVNADYPYRKIYVDKSGFIIDNYEKEKSTKQILINLLPLPEKKDGNIATATTVDDDVFKLRLVFYDGLVNGMPLTTYHAGAFFPQLYLDHWKEWLDYRVRAKTFRWKFYLPQELAKKINENRLIFAFRNYLIPKKITKTRISTEVYEVEIEADRLLQ